MLDTVTTYKIAFTVRALRDALKQVKHAMSREETRYYLGGIFMHYEAKERAFCFVATDGHRLARVMVRDYDFECEAPAQIPSVILPRQFVLDILKATSKARFRHRSYYMLVSRTKLVYPNPEKPEENIEAEPIDGTFPDYLRVIPRGDIFRPQVNRESFLQACSALSAACEAVDKTPCLKLTFEGKQLKLTAANDLFEALALVDLAKPVEIDASKDTQFQIGFNGRYLTDILAAIEGHDVTIRATDCGSPTIFERADNVTDKALHVCMPMRV